MANFWRFLRPVFSASHVQHISDHIVCGSMVDIQSAMAENRRVKKIKKKKKKPQDENIMSASSTQSGHKNGALFETYNVAHAVS